MISAYQRFFDYSPGSPLFLNVQVIVFAKLSFTLLLQIYISIFLSFDIFDLTLLTLESRFNIFPFLSPTVLCFLCLKYAILMKLY